MTDVPPTGPDEGWVPPSGPPPPPSGAPVPPGPPGPPPPAYPSGSQPPPPAWPAGDQQQPPPPYGAPPGYAPPQYQPAGFGPEPSKGLAIGAFVTSLFPLVITQVVGFVLGVVAINKANKGEAGGKGLAIAAVVISLVWSALIVIGLLVDTEEDKAERARDEGSGDINVTKIEAGDCLTELPSGEMINTVSIADCDRTHVGEVYSVFSIDAPENATQADINRLAEGGCTAARFTKYVGKEFNSSDLDVLYIRPNPATIELDDQVSCVLVLPKEAESTGSLKGSKR